MTLVENYILKHRHLEEMKKKLKDDAKILMNAFPLNQSNHFSEDEYEEAKEPAD